MHLLALKIPSSLELTNISCFTIGKALPLRASPNLRVVAFRAVEPEGVGLKVYHPQGYNPRAPEGVS
jgi:hypothetical protein